MRIRQGKSGKYPELGTVTEIEGVHGKTLHGRYRKRKGKVLTQEMDAQEIIDSII